MNQPITIEKIGEIKQVQLVVEASKRDSFSGTNVLAATLPFNFPYGVQRTLQHSCGQCSREIDVKFTYKGNLLTSNALSRKSFHNDRALLDTVGALFEQYLYNVVDINGFEIYTYLTKPDNATGALLNVGYYRCSHCQAQYLIAYQIQLQEDRPPFEPDTITIKKIIQVRFDHTAFLSVLNPQALQNASAS